MKSKKVDTNQHAVYDPSQEGYQLFRSPFYLIAHADFRYHEDVSAVLLKHGVNKSMYRIMTVLREAEPTSISYLAEHALIKRNTVSRIVERMVELGFATTEPDPTDNRITIVTLTMDGHTLLNTLTPVVARQVKRAMQGISDAALEQLVTTLQQIGENLAKLSIE